MLRYVFHAGSQAILRGGKMPDHCVGERALKEHTSRN